MESQGKKKRKRIRRENEHTAVIHALFLNGRPGAHAWLAVATTTTSIRIVHTEMI
jgi:hypothetical protein